jgi:hypothetical protein
MKKQRGFIDLVMYGANLAAAGMILMNPLPVPLTSQEKMEEIYTNVVYPFLTDEQKKNLEKANCKEKCESK